MNDMLHITDYTLPPAGREAAGTKWNFHRYSPGLVGGHCIPVDLYYLVHRAKKLGYHPQVILAGRAINDSMPAHVAGMMIRGLNEAGKVIKGSKVLIMGLAYKENVADTRESPAIGIVGEGAVQVDVGTFESLLRAGVMVQRYSEKIGNNKFKKEVELLLKLH